MQAPNAIRRVDSFRKLLRYCRGCSCYLASEKWILNSHNCLLSSLQEVAMENSQNVWIDGSLRNGEWFSRVFGDIREVFCLNVSLSLQLQFTIAANCSICFDPFVQSSVVSALSEVPYRYFPRARRGRSC